MRIAGILSALGSLLVLAYAWFAAGWDGGTARELGDRIMMGVALAMLIASGALALGHRRASWLLVPAWGLVLLVAIAP